MEIETWILKSQATKSQITAHNCITFCSKILGEQRFHPHWEITTTHLPNHHNEVKWASHNNDVIMSAIEFQITSLTVVYSTVFPRRRPNKTSKLRVTVLCEGNSPATGEFPTKTATSITRKMFSFDDVIMRHLNSHAPRLLVQQFVQNPSITVDSPHKGPIMRKTFPSVILKRKLKKFGRCGDNNHIPTIKTALMGRIDIFSEPMSSWFGDAFKVTGPLWGKSTSDR